MCAVWHVCTPCMLVVTVESDYGAQFDCVSMYNKLAEFFLEKLVHIFTDFISLKIMTFMYLRNFCLLFVLLTSFLTDYINYYPYF